MQKQFNVFDHYKVDAYLGAMGLSVLPKYRGRNIGAQILKARVPLCKAIGVKLTTTVFTAIASQVLAKKVGFEDNYEETYEDMAKLGPHLTFHGINSKSCKLASLRIE
jgi:GNAT superfamily N-acetyltransferase